MSTKHTPGPWRVDTRLTGHRYNGHPVRYFSVAHTTETRDCFIATETAPTELIHPGEGVDRIEPNTEGEANARLIAAAPELLAALQALFALGNGEIETPLTQRTGWSKFEQQARAAITKAEATP